MNQEVAKEKVKDEEDKEKGEGGGEQDYGVKESKGKMEMAESERGSRKNDEGQ